LFQRNIVSTFFRKAFGQHSGIVCVALLSRQNKEMRERFFEYPKQLDRMLDIVEQGYDENDVYFCPQLLNARARKKENVVSCPTIWADLDTCEPEKMLVKPTLSYRTSPGRYQALWELEDPIEPQIAEAIARRIAYFHADDGSDRSGWDLTQLLRVPGTHNFKYDDQVAGLHISVHDLNAAVYRARDFNKYPEVIGRDIGDEIPFHPEDIPVIGDPLDFLQSKRKRLNPTAFSLVQDVPPTDVDWSGILWRMCMLLFEGGLTREEVYAVAEKSGCNKFKRDNKDPIHLWRDVVKAWSKHQENINVLVIPEYHQTELITDEELERIEGRETFVERYIEWASGLGDAAVQYHQAGAFIILSALLAGKTVLPTSFGNVVPNIWFMILADTTLTRKSTAMDIATDLLIEVYPEAIMATDGSIEGLMTGLSTRPNMPSIFLRDEFSGLIEAMTKKDYMAGMPEMLTKMYDGKYQKRMLRKEPIEVKDPILIVFAGGIKNRTQQMLTLDHVSSGFMPRFVFITAESDPSKVQPMGPPIVRDLTGRVALLDEMAEMYDFYHTEPITSPSRGIKTRGQPKVKKWEATLTPAAWRRFNKFEDDLMQAGIKSDRPDLLTPVYDRLGKSALKASLLIAASSNRDEEGLEITEDHILMAIRYARSWREHALEVINGVGKSAYERDIERTLALIKRKPGITRSAIMQHYHMTATSANNLFQTMEQRGLVATAKFGASQTFRLMPKPGDVQVPEEETV
jgi:hypothetical protein